MQLEIPGQKPENGLYSFTVSETEGQRLFYTLPNTVDNLEDAIKALEEHFLPKRNVVVERHAFRK